MSCQKKCSEARDGEPCRFCLCQYVDELDTDKTTAATIMIVGDEYGDDSSCSPMLNGGW